MEKLLTALFTACLICTTAFSQPSQTSQPHKPLGKKEIRDVVTALADSVGRIYVDEKIATNISKQLRQQLTKGEYDKVDNPQELSTLLTNQLIKLSNDKHFGVNYMPPNASSGTMRRTMPGSYKHLEAYNYYFNKMEILPGNVGLLELDQFVPTDYTGQLIVAAMNFFSNSDALIIDLRKCIGGDPRTVAQLAGYFFQDPVLLHISYNRAQNIRNELWTTKTSFQAIERGGPNTSEKIINTDYSKLAAIPIYILTSNSTFSSAELLSYGLQARKRAKIVGETTGGGGNGIRPFSLPNGFTAFIPFVQSINAVTGTAGWQNTGVLPDITSISDKALDVAYSTILQQLLSQTTDENTRKRLSWVNHLHELRQKNNSANNLHLYAGNYGDVEIIHDKDALYYHRKGDLKKQLEPLDKEHFLLDKQTMLEFSADYQSFRIQRMNGTTSNPYERKKL